MDYIADRSLPVLVLVDRQSKSIWAHAVPNKGVGHPYPAAAVVRDLQRSGCKNIIFKSDNEPSIIALMRAVQKD